MDLKNLTVLSSASCKNIIIVGVPKDLSSSYQEIVQSIVSLLQKMGKPLRQDKNSYLLAGKECEIRICLSDREDQRNIVFCSIPEKDGCQICWENFEESCAFIQW